MCVPNPNTKWWNFSSNLFPSLLLSTPVKIGPEDVIILKNSQHSLVFSLQITNSNYLSSVDGILHHGKEPDGPRALNINPRTDSTLVIVVTCCSTSIHDSNQPWHTKTTSTYSTKLRTRYLNTKARTILWPEANRSRRLHRTK